MSDTENSRTYVSMMRDSLRRKRDVLHLLYSLTEKQEQLLRADTPDADAFDETLEEKGRKIEELDGLDSGFDALFKKVEEELTADKDKYVSEISDMKKCIEEITELHAKIQAAEKRNDERFKKYLASEKGRVRKASLSQQTAMTYVQNMSETHKPGSSYFFNEAK